MRSGATASAHCSRNAGIDVLFVPPSSDLEYLTGIERDLPSFGNISYAHGWVAGAFLAPGREPLFVLPRMVVAFHLDGKPPPGAVVVNEDADGRALFAEAVRSLGRGQPDRAQPAGLGGDGDRVAAGRCRTPS